MRGAVFPDARGPGLGRGDRGQGDARLGRRGTSERPESLRGDRVRLVGTEDGSEEWGLREQ